MKPSEMNDEDLIRVVSEEVMEWQEVHYFGKGRIKHPCWQDKEGNLIIDWQPLTCPDHWWMVVLQMRELGYRVSIYDADEGEYEISFYQECEIMLPTGLAATEKKINSQVEGKIGRAVCEAALAAMRAKED